MIAPLHLGLVLALAAPRPIAAPDPAPTPILGGSRVEPGAWPEVVALKYFGDGTCTGTLVSDRVVLTAAHCIVNAGASLLWVALGDDARTPDRVVAIERVGYHPDYCSDLTVCKADIWDYGFVVLAEPVLDVAPARPLLLQEEWDEAMATGETVTLVGYGFDDDNRSDVKRQADASIRRFSRTGLEFQAGGDGVDTCNGDSGGPAFVTLASGAVRLAGVTSRGSDPCGKGGIYGIPAAAMCWLYDETGVDLRAADCGTCDCLDTTPDRERRCGCRSPDPAGALPVLLLLGRRRRRARPPA